MKYLLCQIGLLATIAMLTGCTAEQQANIPPVEIQSTQPDNQTFVDVDTQTDTQTDVQTDNTNNTTSNINETQYITDEEAKEIAFNHANISASDVTIMKCKFEYDKGVPEYDVEFYVNGVEYDYEINAITGEIVSFDVDNEKAITDFNNTVSNITNSNSTNSNSTNSNSTNSNSSQYITDEQAKDIAFTHANVNSADATLVKCKIDYDDGIIEYEVEFVVGGVEYEYDINAITGDILSFDIDNDHATTTNNTSTGNTNNTTSSTDKITEEQAKAIAFTHANVLESNASLVKCKLDFDDGIYEYEIEFFVNGVEYEYEINASTGGILSFDIDNEKATNNNANNATSSTDKITQEQAKDIAFTHANILATNATSIKCELDFDDGIYEYEVEFKVGKIEYEYSINATTGQIISFEIDD